MHVRCAKKKEVLGYFSIHFTVNKKYMPMSNLMNERYKVPSVKLTVHAVLFDVNTVSKKILPLCFHCEVISINQSINFISY